MDSEQAVFARRIGQVVGGRWRLERLLGIGGMAAVYAASSTDGRTAAIKLLHPEMSRRKDVRERFVRESGVANRLGHPGVVQILEHGEDGEDAYLAMELLEGESLAERVQRQGGMSHAELLDYLDQALDVLVVAHEKGVIHRDLKPENLFVGKDGKLKVLDFGLARLLDDVPGAFKTRTGLALGTLPYMAPEQALGRREAVDGRVDLFALGATAFRILAGRKVHEAPSEAELLVAMATRPAPPLADVAALPPELCSIVDLALAFSKDARYPSARVMQEDVRAVRRGQPPPYAQSRRAAREEATRADRPAPRLATVPLPAVPAVPAATALGSAPAPAAPTPTGAAPVGSAPATAAVTTSPTAAAPGRSPRRTWLAVALAALSLCSLAIAWGVSRSSDSDASTAAEPSARAPSAAQPSLAAATDAPEPSSAAPAAAARADSPAARAAPRTGSSPANPSGAAPAAQAASVANPSSADPAAQPAPAAPAPETARAAAVSPGSPAGTNPAPGAASAAPPPPVTGPAPPPPQPAAEPPERRHDKDGPGRGKRPRGRDRRGRD